MCHFGIQNDPFLLNKMFLVQTTIITFIYLLAFFIVQNFKKFLLPIQSYEDAHNFWAQNGPFPQMRIFFRKPGNELCFFHPCLSTWQKSKWDINLLVKYWRLKNTEKNPEKTNDMIFLRSPKSLFFCNSYHFW